MENPIYMMIVDDPSSGQIVSAKKTVMIVAGTINLSIYKMVYVDNLYPSIIRLFFYTTRVPINPKIPLTVSGYRNYKHVNKPNPDLLGALATLLYWL